MFITAYHVEVDAASAALVRVEVNIFLSDRWLITVRNGGEFPIENVIARWDRSPKLAQHGVGFLLYGLLDVIVDGYFTALDSFDEFYEEVSDRIFSEHPVEVSRQRDWFDMRREFVGFHRLVVPMREVVSSLMRREQGVVSEALYPYYQDVYDHILRISESSDALRDLVSALVEANLSLRDYRQNLVVKKVSSWAAIVAVPAMITGYYGMNVPYPGSGSVVGVIVSAVLIVGVSGGLYLLFRSNDWL
jgi:magnesium transporter